MYKPVSALENEKHKIIWDLEIQTHYLIPATRKRLKLINKEKYYLSIGFTVPVDHWVIMWDREKIVEYEGHSINEVNYA